MFRCKIYCTLSYFRLIIFQDYFVFVNGLEGTLVLRKALDYETLSNFTIGIRAQVFFFKVITRAHIPMY